ncbi:MAG: ROK family protein, partial [Pseudoflavonifractor sp.]
METELKGDTRRRILQYLFRHGAASRQALAAALGVSMPTVLSHVQALVGQGLAAEDGQYDSTGGRRAAVITGVPSARLALGVDVTGRDLGLAVADLAGRLLFHRRAALRYRNEPAYYEALGALTREFWADSAGSAPLPLGVGVSIAGILSPDGARITTSHTLNVQNVDCGLFRAVLPGDCLFINDANAAGLAEMSELGGARSMVYLSLSGSVGGAVFMQGKLALGANQRCGEVGHLRLLPGRRCYCGQDGCADAYCNAGVLSALSGGRLDLFF